MVAATARASKPAAVSVNADRNRLSMARLPAVLHRTK
jgi:hypothetical protein